MEEIYDEQRGTRESAIGSKSESANHERWDTEKELRELSTLPFFLRPPAPRGCH